MLHVLDATIEFLEKVQEKNEKNGNKSLSDTFDCIYIEIAIPI
jgi:hypothetical protein